MEIAELKMQLEVAQSEKKALYLISRVKSTEKNTKEFFENALELINDYKANFQTFASKYNLDEKTLNRANKEGEKAILEILG